MCGCREVRCINFMKVKKSGITSLCYSRPSRKKKIEESVCVLPFITLMVQTFFLTFKKNYQSLDSNFQVYH
jgi:hypothetical protein